MKFLWIFIALLLMGAVSVSALDYWHGDTCDRPAGVDATPKILNKPWWGTRTVEQGVNAEFDVEITGRETGSFVCELGIYYEEEVAKWYGGNLPLQIGTWEALTGNCVEGENFVITKRAPIQKGQTIDVKYSVAVPSSYNQEDPVVVHVMCFNNCWNCDPDNFKSYGSDVMRLKLTGNNLVPEDHCDNFITDSDESDLDCGGADCEKCDYKMLCKDDSDCKLNSCYNGRCQDKPETPEPGEDGGNLEEEFAKIELAYILGGALLFGGIGIVAGPVGILGGAALGGLVGLVVAVVI